MDEVSENQQFIEEQRQWLRDYREKTGNSWAYIAKRSGIALGTLSQFGGAKGYGGDEFRVAEQISRFRHSLTQQAAIGAHVPQRPDFFPTETSDLLERMLGFAQTGEIVAAALEAGCGKTITAKHYQTCFPSVFHVEICKSASAPNSMLLMVLRALGVRNPSGGTLNMSQQVVELLKKVSKPLLIIDEAQHLNEASLEEIRSWNDIMGVGIAFFGNVGVLQKMAKYAQLFSRLSLKHIQRCPLSSDIDKFADAWNVTDQAIRAELQKICGRLGGLRNGHKAMQLAWMIASSDGKPLNIDHLRDAWRELDARLVAA